MSATNIGSSGWLAANTNLRFRRTMGVVETLVSLGGLAGSCGRVVVLARLCERR